MKRLSRGWQKRLNQSKCSCIISGQKGLRKLRLQQVLVVRSSNVDYEESAVFVCVTNWPCYYFHSNAFTHHLKRLCVLALVFDNDDKCSARQVLYVVLLLLRVLVNNERGNVLELGNSNVRLDYFLRLFNVVTEAKKLITSGTVLEIDVGNYTVGVFSVSLDVIVIEYNESCVGTAIRDIQAIRR